MFIHPQIHLEIARQRHQDLLVEADRRRLAKASEGLGCVWPALQSSASTSRRSGIRMAYLREGRR
jgi:hypothetical protein